MAIQRIRSGLFHFGDGCIRVDRIRTNNQERIINNASKQVSLLNVLLQNTSPQQPCFLALNNLYIFLAVN